MRNFLLGIFFLSTMNVYAGPVVNCQLDMHQVDKNAPWGLVGDTNKRIDVTLNPMDPPYSNEFMAEQVIRFHYDQSQGGERLSQHGVNVQVSYSEGNGLSLNMRILHYKNENADSSSEVLGAVLTSTLEIGAESVAALNVGYVPAKIASLSKDAHLKKLLSDGVLLDGDLYSIGLMGCRFSK